MPSRMQLYVTHQDDDDAERTVPLSADRPFGSMVKSPPLGHGPTSAPAPSRGAPGGSGHLGAPRGRGPATRRPAAASSARASRLEGRRFHDLLPSRLGPQLLALQSSGYAVPGIPIVQVVIKGSAYEKEFRQRTGRAG